MVDKYSTRFRSLEKNVYSRQPEFVQDLRRSAMDRFTELGFPTTRLEEWRNTNVSSIARTFFRSPDDMSNNITIKFLTPYFLKGTNRFVFANGKLSKDLSSFTKLPRKVEITSLADSIDQSRDELALYLGQIADYHNHPFIALNTAFMDDGIFIFIPPNQVVDLPIHVIYAFSPSENDTVHHVRNLIRIDSNSQVTVVEHYIGFGDQRYLANVVTEIEAGENSSLNHIKIQQDTAVAQHISVNQIHQLDNSQVSLCSISVGSQLTRNDVNVVLDGEGSECIMNGLVLAKKKQHIDNHTIIDHAKPHCTSKELYKGIHYDRSHGVFNGRIIVRQNAQKTNASQENKNILLSDTALVNSNPQLEIYADDVRCTHGSSTGQLDEEALFYLRSRGLDVKTAQSLMINGFASDIINRIETDSVRMYVHGILAKWLSETNEEISA